MVVFRDHDVDERLCRRFAHPLGDIRDGAPCHPLVFLRSDIGNEDVPPASDMGSLHFIGDPRAQSGVTQPFEQRRNAAIKGPFRNIDGKRRRGSAVRVLVAEHLQPLPPRPLDHGGRREAAHLPVRLPGDLMV